MRRVGTISSSIGLIFLGIWMILNRTNPSYAQEMFKWWPVIIIFIGIEVLIYFSRKSENGRIGFSFLIIPVIIIFIIINITQSVENKLGLINNGKGISFNNAVDYFKNFDDDRYKGISTSKTLDKVYGSFTFNTDNADINIKKSDDGKIKLNLKIYVEKNENIDSYSLKESDSGGNVNININEDYVKKVSGDIYVPDGCITAVNTDNLRLSSTDTIANLTFKIKSDNSSVTIDEADNVTINSDNISAEAKKIGSLNINSDSGLVKVDGSIDNLKLVMDNGKIDVDNDSGKNVEIQLNDGMVNYKTGLKDIDANLELDNGICSFNGERRVNSGISQKTGSGENKIHIKLDDGTLSFAN